MTDRRQEIQASYKELGGKFGNLYESILTYSSPVGKIMNKMMWRVRLYSDGESIAGVRTMKINKERLVAFTDAIIAIAATIMVLELVTPEDTSIHGLFSQWPTFVAYLTSFDLIYLVWLNHHNAFQKIDHVTSGVFIWNGIWTFFLTLVPFATRWVGEHPNDTLPEFLYILVLFAWSLMFQLMDNRIIKDFPGTKPDATNNRKTRLPMYIGYAVAMIVSFFLPIATLILILVMVAAMTVGIFRMMHADKK